MEAGAPEDLFFPETERCVREETLADGLVLKRVVKEGTGDIIPGDVTIVWALKEGRTRAGKSFQKTVAVMYKLGKKSTCLYNQGEHVLLESMRRGEECWALVNSSMHQISEYASEDLWFRITAEEYLEDIPDTIPANWLFPERKRLSEQCVAIANRLFSTKKYKYAGALYNRGVQALQMKRDLMAALSPADLEFIEQTSLRCWKNFAVTELKASVLCQSERERLGKYATVIENCRRVLAKAPHDTKALYLMAKAHLLREEFETTKKIVHECPPPVPGDLIALLQEVAAREAAIAKKERNRMKVMFDKNVWEVEEEKEREFQLQQQRQVKLEERKAERERRAKRDQNAKVLMDDTLKKAEKGFVIDLHDPDEDGEKFLDMMDRVGEPEDDTESGGAWESPSEGAGSARE